jgi:CRISPR/Cas system CSM-associated protein Csm3 (group 7 of RAMP superfamily)
MVQLQSLRNSVESLQLTAVIDSALCIGAGGSTGSLADKPIVRTAQNQLLIPASQLKGRLRHECEKLARGLRWAVCESPNPSRMCPQRIGASGNFERPEYDIDGCFAVAPSANRIDQITRHHCLICQIFGNPALPAKVQFDDLICVSDPESLAEVLRPGVTISRSRRTAEEQKLYFLETSPVNAELAFVGHIHLRSNCEPWVKALLLPGLQHIHALGGSKSAGLGWLHWQIESESITESAWEFLAKGGRNESD